MESVLPCNAGVEVLPHPLRRVGEVGPGADDAPGPQKVQKLAEVADRRGVSDQDLGGAAQPAIAEPGAAHVLAALRSPLEHWT
jgi:hypothetical protein